MEENKENEKTFMSGASSTKKKGEHDFISAAEENSEVAGQGKR